jgi:hypothetical protein
MHWPFRFDRDAYDRAGSFRYFTEVFQLHRLGRTRVLQARQPLDRVNEAFTEVLDGTAPTPRLISALS